MENPAEVQELRNKLRMMKFPQDEILNTVRKQQRAIHKQKQANETIRQECVEYQAQIDAYDQAVAAHDSNEDLNSLKNTEKNLSNKLSVLSADYAAEDQKRRELEDKVSKARSAVGGMYAQSREIEESQAKIRTMENRLDKSLVRYNNNLTQLSEKRNQIDELRKDRTTFRQVIEKSKAECAALAATIEDQIRTSNDSYSQRDNLKMCIAELKNNEAAEIQHFESDMDRLTQTIEGQRIASNRPHEQLQSVPTIISQSGTSEAQDEITKQTEEFQAQISRTLELLNMKSTEELFQEAENLERENFSLFNFVVEHGATRTRLTDEISALEMQHDAILSHSQSNDESQARELEEITNDIEDTKNQLNDLENQKKASEDAFKENYQKIDELYQLLGCSWEKSPDEKSTVTSANVMFALTNIETAIIEIMDKVSAKAKSAFDVQPESRSQAGLDSFKPEKEKKHVLERIDDNALKTLETCNEPLSLDDVRKLIKDPSSPNTTQNNNNTQPVEQE